MKEFLKKHKYVLIIIAVIMIVFAIIKALALPYLFSALKTYLTSKSDNHQVAYEYYLSMTCFVIISIISYLSVSLLCIFIFLKSGKTKLEKQQILLQKKQNEVEKLQKKIDNNH